MNLTTEQLDEVQEMAGLFFSPEDIADNLEVDADDFREEIESKTGKIYHAWRRGWLTAEVALRKSILQASNNGSNPAQQMMLNFQRESRL